VESGRYSCNSEEIKKRGGELQNTSILDVPIAMNHDLNGFIYE
jgi:hypothetical protein